MRIFGVILKLFDDSFHSTVAWNLFDLFFIFKVFSQLFYISSLSFNFRHFEFVNTIYFVEWFKSCFLNSLFDRQVSKSFFNTSDSNTEDGFLLKKFKTFFKISCQITFASWCNCYIFKSITTWANGKWVYNDFIIN